LFGNSCIAFFKRGLRRIVKRDKRAHAGQSLGLGGIDADDFRVRKGAAENLSWQRIDCEKVSRKRRGADDLGAPIDALDRVADNLQRIPGLLVDKFHKL
jgi:hypothetical protein